MRGHRLGIATATTFAFLAGIPTHAQAQLGRRGAAESTGWPPVEVGARVGYDQKQQQEVVGALLRVPVLRSRRIILMPNADVTFLRGFKEYQVNFEAVYAQGGPEAGLYAGGGAGFRSTIVPSGPGEPESGRERLRTYSVVVGVSFGRVGRVNPMIEVRRLFARRLPVDPQQFNFGVAFALW